MIFDVFVFLLLFLFSDCPTPNFKCANGLCMSSNLRCDKRNDCGDNSDEYKCCTYMHKAVWHFKN